MTNVKKWIQAATVRAVKTAAQTALGVIGATTTVTAVDWTVVGYAAALAAITSYLTSLKGLPEVPKEGEGK